MTDRGPRDWVPEACKLPTAERPLRSAEFDDLFVASAQATQRLSTGHLRVELAGASDVESSVRDLARRETECCSFFTFSVTTPRPGRVRLDIEVPQAYAHVLDALEARATAVRRS